MQADEVRLAEQLLQRGQAHAERLGLAPDRRGASTRGFASRTGRPAGPARGPLWPRPTIPSVRPGISPPITVGLQVPPALARDPFLLGQPLRQCQHEEQGGGGRRVVQGQRRVEHGHAVLGAGRRGRSCRNPPPIGRSPPGRSAPSANVLRFTQGRSTTRPSMPRMCSGVTSSE